QRYWSARQRYAEQGLAPVRAALAGADFIAADQLVREKVNPLYEEANARAVELLNLLSNQARANFNEVNERNELIATVAVAGIALSSLAVLLCGLFFFRGAVLPLQSAVTALERIAEGNLSGENGHDGYGEPGRVMASVSMMQLHLKVMIDEIRCSSGSIREQCARLNQTMMNVAQHSEEQHDRVYQTVDAAAVSCDGLKRLADDAEALLLLAERAGAWCEPAPAPALAETVAAAEPALQAAPTPAAEPSDLDWLDLEPEPCAAQEDNLAQRAQGLAAAARIEAFSMSDTMAQMNQVAMLIVENRGDVQDAWAASQQLESTAAELDKLVKYFD
ncbi:MAG: methyl-accepting chemotaxis protein, partial [Burkholderiaceae bacterium]|nr:methyl-accepting chemotaxis protein [Burkholderiaceae bacterium]